MSLRAGESAAAIKAIQLVNSLEDQLIHFERERSKHIPDVT